ncbi:MAG: cupredoxin family copper-binding protein [Thermomicrobiales bacterium]
MFFRRRLMPIAVLLAAFAVVSGLMIGFGSPTKAQEDQESHPAHIHDGTCGSGLGDVVYPLDNVGGGTMMGTPVSGQQMGASDAIPVQTSTTVVKTTLEDLVGEAYAINVHESKENIGNYIACGNIGGQVVGGTLAIGLAELNNSGYSGIAWLRDNGDGTTTVLVGLTETGAEGGAATPAASPAASTNGGATEQAVTIQGFAFNPPTLTIPVGTTVTWTNQDSAPHTATSNDGAFQSGKLDQGKSYSFTFDKAGTYDYHCEYHANMHGTITVQ